MPFSITQSTIVYFTSVSLTLWLGYSQLMIKRSLSLLIMPILIALSGWNRSLQLIGIDIMLLIFAIYRVVCSACNRLDLVVTNAPHIVNLFIGTTLGTSDHCFIVVCLVSGNLYRSTISDVLSF